MQDFNPFDPGVEMGTGPGSLFPAWKRGEVTLSNTADAADRIRICEYTAAKPKKVSVCERISQFLSSIFPQLNY